MNAYHPQRRITLSFAVWKGREYVAAAFGGDTSLRQRLMQQPGAVANDIAVYLPADGFVLADFFNRLTLLSKSFTKKLTEYNELYRIRVWLSEHVPGKQFSELHFQEQHQKSVGRHFRGGRAMNILKDNNSQIRC